MKLSEKGRFAPPPTLPTHAQRVADAMGTWEGVHVRTHWRLGNEQIVDGTDFYVGEHEVGHLHLDGVAHVMVPRTLATAVIASGLGSPFEWSRGAVVFAVGAARDVAHALWLFQLSYDRARGATAADLVDRVREAAALKARRAG